MYHNNTCLGYVANLAHHVDVGGGAPASIGAFREVFPGGRNHPAGQLVERGELVPNIFDLILAQIRAKREIAGDLRAQIAANNTGVRRLCALADRIGGDTVSFYIRELIAYTERRTRVEMEFAEWRFFGRWAGG